jgi:Rod binding domain-containing protein
MGDMFAKALTMGGTGLGLARKLLTQLGEAPAADPAAGASAATPGKVPAVNGQRVPLED